MNVKVEADKSSEPAKFVVALKGSLGEEYNLDHVEINWTQLHGGIALFLKIHLSNISLKICCQFSRLTFFSRDMLVRNIKVGAYNWLNNKLNNEKKFYRNHAKNN